MVFYSRVRRLILTLTILLALGLMAQAQTVTINAANGTAFNPGVRGHNIFNGLSTDRPMALGLGHNTALRSLPAGGLDADCYDWKLNRGSVTYETYKTTLQVLQELRDHKSTGIWTANVVGTGNDSGGSWICYPRFQTDAFGTDVQKVSDGDGDTVAADMTYDDGGHILLRDANDSIRVKIRVTVGGTFRLHARVRSGYSGDSTAYWRLNLYSFQFNGSPITFTGDTRTISAPEGDGTYWGSMNSTATVSLAANTDHWLTVTALGEWARLDYVGIGEETASLAADWVRYTNRIVQIYRQGDTITDATDQRILNEITWSPKLLPAGEAAVPKAMYWEIGNEPEINYPTNHILTTTNYAWRYRLLTTAMKAEDSTILTGPCITDAGTTSAIGAGKAYLDAIKTLGTTMNFVAYHPYYSSLKSAWPAGGSANITNLQNGLRDLKGFYDNRKTALTTWNYGTSTYLATEFNPSYWDMVGQPLAMSMAHALGVTDSVLTFAQEGLFAAQYWERPGMNPPAYKMWKALQDYLGDRYITSYSDGSYFRLYATKNSTGSPDIVVWALNFSDSADKPITLNFDNLPASRSSTYTVTKMVLRNPSGDTSLTSQNSTVNWVRTVERKTGAQLDSYALTCEDATVTVLLVHPVPLAPNSSTDKRQAFVRNDFDGDRKTDLAYIRTLANGTYEWHVLRSQLNFDPYNEIVYQYGSSASPYFDIPAVGDYDGDGKADMTVARAGTPMTWYINQSSTWSSRYPYPSYGNTGNAPISGDFDADGITDIGVIETWRSPMQWLVARSIDGQMLTYGIGNNGDTFLVGDCDGEGSADPGIRMTYLSPTAWWVLNSQGTQWLMQRDWRYSSEKALLGDYDGDGRMDTVAISPGAPLIWRVFQSSTGTENARSCGNNDDLTLMGDYDGDGRYDYAVYENWANRYVISYNASGAMQIIPFGTANDYHLGTRIER